ncbi:MAG TPA: zinc ribbon domain-containing protein [Nitrospirota bacterium]|nr:zinc ribbon domain-containing protein [Nitrospirota bacterium]
MPIYEYQCGSCGGRFEVTQKFSDPLLSRCKLCNAEGVRKVLSPATFVLKGSGWYVTDYASGDRKKAGEESEKPCKEGSKPSTGCTTGTCASGACASKG